MTKQISLVAASVACAIAGTAHAGNLTPFNPANELNSIFVGGATAPQNFMREDVMQRICDPATGPVQVFVDKVTVLPSPIFGGNIMEQGDHFVVHCTARSTFASSLDGADIAVYKFNGGSATGVAPVVDPAGASDGDKTYLDAALPADNPACSAVTGGIGGANAWPIGATDDGAGNGFSDTFELYECDSSTAGDPTLLQVQAPDAGVSDVEPTLFVKALALSFGTEPRGVADKPTQPFVDQGNLVVVPGPGLIFGTAVTLPMYDELVKDQVANGMLPSTCNTTDRAILDTVECMPSLPAPLIRSVFAGQVTDWSQVAPYGQALDTSGVTGIGYNPLAGIPSSSNDVAICKRTNGSGTHAQFSVNFLGTNCRATSDLAMLEQNDGLASATFFNQVGVFANSGSSDMSDCLDALGNGLGFNGDFKNGLPPESFPGGDSTVVPGTALAAIAIPGDPFGRLYNQQTTAFAMGYNATEHNVALTFDYRYVKVDGKAPTLQEAIKGEYRDVYYLSYQNREPVAGSPDLQVGGIRTTAASANQVAVADAYFDIWNAVAPAALAPVNEGFIVDPNGSVNAGLGQDGDEWQAGFVSPIKGAAFTYTPGVPETPWARQNPANNGADSCQDLGLVR